MKGKIRLKQIVSFLIAFAMMFSFMQISNIKSASAVTAGNENTQVPGLIFRVGDENGDIRIVDRAADDKDKYVIRQLPTVQRFTLDSEEGYSIVSVDKIPNMTVSETSVGGKKRFSIVNIKDYSAFVLSIKIQDPEGNINSYDINIDFRTDSSLEFKDIVISYSGSQSYTDTISFGATDSDGTYVTGPVESGITKAAIELHDNNGLSMDFTIKGNSGKTVDLIGGENKIELVVTSSGISKMYTLIIKKKGQALLKSLTPSTGTLSPAFNSDIYDYEVTVPTTQEKIAFTPVAIDNSTKIKVKKSTVASGKRSQEISLEEGKNRIPITVTTSDGESVTYTVIVTRTEKFRSTALTGLRLTSGTLSPTFNKGIFEYTAVVENSVTSVGVTPTAEDSNATIKVNNKTVPSGATSPYISLDEGGNTINVVVTDSKGEKSTYTINITRRYPKNNVNLSSLSVTDGKLSPIFDPEIYLYSAKVARNIDSVRIKFTTQNDKAKVKINDVEYPNGQSDKIKLNLGVNTVKIQVVAEDGKSTTTYVLSIIRDKVEGKYEWVVENGQMTYYDGYGIKVKNNWVKYDNKWYFMDLNGYMQTGWKQIGGLWYYFNENGVMHTGWFYDKGYWYYLQGNGSLRTSSWAMLDGKWYLFNELGEMQTGWHQYLGNWYYLSDEGVMQKGWITYDKNKYYLNDDGSMRTGWLFNGKVWYYFGPEGQMRTGWQTIDGTDYYFDASGAMLTGMHFLDGRWIDLGNA